MARQKAPTQEKELPEVPTSLPIIREIHQFIPSEVNPLTGREEPERLVKHKEWNEDLEVLANTKGKILINCIEWHLVDGERICSQCVQIPYQEARRWFDEGMGMYDVSGEVETILTGKRQAERTDAILEKLAEQSSLNQDILKALVALLEKKEEGD